MCHLVPPYNKIVFLLDMYNLSIMNKRRIVKEAASTIGAASSLVDYYEKI